MKVLILGGSGMVGHKFWQCFVDRFDTYVTLHRVFSSCLQYKLFAPTHTLDRVSVEDFDTVIRAVAATQPDVVVNCIGIIKQRAAAKASLPSIMINALFPHRLAQLCQATGSRLIHISTDCVFSGRYGNYAENDVSDAEDLYGRTKFLGEIDQENCLTVRTSMIGRELGTSYGLLEWFLSQQGGIVSGYKRAVFSGFTTIALAEIIARIITAYPNLQGVRHVAAEPINKFELLSLIKQVYRLDIQIEPDEKIAVDRSLNADRFRRETGFTPPTWPEMIEQMYQDPTPYSEFRRPYVNR